MLNIIDCLYGNIKLDISKSVICSPELQRLRSIRLCNINSPYVTGGDHLNRFEHALGTAYLAQEIIDSHTSNKNERTAFILAALLHDIVTAPFGHSLEYLFESIKSIEYEHAKIHKMYLSGSTIPNSRNIYYGCKLNIEKIIERNIFNLLTSILDGDHCLSRLLDYAIDIDNIDNVFRFAYHIGIDFNKNTPLQLSKALKLENNILVIKRDNIPFIQEWFDVREKLYTVLLENSGEFVAKALLERCFIECVSNDTISDKDWILTDNDMISKIYNSGNSTAVKTITKLMTMDFPSHSRIFFTNNYVDLDNILKNNKIEIINKAFSNNVYLHFIRDVNKTRRIISGAIDDIGSNELFSIGVSNDRYLIGFFSENIRTMNETIDSFRHEFSIDLMPIGDDHNVSKQASLF